MDDLAAMETSKVHYFWRALTLSQRKHAVALGHIAPLGACASEGVSGLSASGKGPKSTLYLGVSRFLSEQITRRREPLVIAT
jgi:hypothetical protein